MMVMILLFKITGRWLSAFSKAKWRFPILFEVPPELEILMRLPVKSPELVSVFIEASKNLKK
jgi:hypothetical protein